MLEYLTKNQVSIVLNVRPESFERLERENLTQKQIYPYEFYAMVYNFNRPPFDELRYRQAVNYGTNKSTLAKCLLKVEFASGYVNSSIFSHNYQFVKDSQGQGFQSFTSFDSDKASQLLSKFDGQGGFTLLISSEMEGKQLSQMALEYKRMMEIIGIEVTISDQTEVQYLSMLKQRNYDAVFLHYRGLDHFYDVRPLFGENSDCNLFHFNNHTLDSLLDKFGRTISYEELLKLTRSIHSQVEAFTPACFLFTLPNYAFYDNRLENVFLHPEVGFAKINQWTMVKDEKGKTE